MSQTNMITSLLGIKNWFEIDGVEFVVGPIFPVVLPIPVMLDSSHIW